MFQHPERPDPALNIALRLGVALAFTLAGIDKFPADPYWLHVFDAIGFGQWFRYLTGIVEVVGGLLFLIPALTALGAFFLISTMTGAIVVQIVVFHRPADALFPGLFFIGALIAFMKLRTLRLRRAASREVQ